MDEVFDIIFSCLSGIVASCKALTFTAFGFTLSLWDFKVALFLLSCFIPIFFSLRHTDSLARYSIRHSESISERNDTISGSVKSKKK